jgi:phosphoribosylformimino-5-aminoimidazole carboxamide ribotide isomerase
MRVYPAIDLLGGVAVRLREGRREDATVYDREPWAVARRFAEAGAARVHVVDLDGAFAGRPENRAAVGRILAEAGVAVQVGGGVRDRAAAEALYTAGADRVVLGTAAVKDPALVAELCRAHPGGVVVAIDARGGRVAIEGWVTATDVRATDLAQRMVDAGAAALLYTDVARDGTEVGPNVEATAELARAIPIEVIASGGIGSLAHVRALAAAGIPACVVGRALYEARFTVAEAIAAGGA